MTTFRNKEPGPVTVSVSGRGQFFVASGGEFDTDDEAEVEALRGNPSLEEVGAGQKAKEKIKEAPAKAVDKAREAGAKATGKKGR